MPTTAARLAVLGIAWIAGHSFPAYAADEPVQLEAYSPLAEAGELARRTQTPTTFDRLQRFAEASGQYLRGHSVDLSRELFDVYPPRERLEPGKRFGLLVWISPHERMPAPREWRNALDAHDMILVSARESGNDQGTLERRLPLALHAVHNLAARHPIDPDRVYAGGFSGGSRAALRLAVGYPDVFRGALLAAGSDALGGGGISPPAVELMEALQARSRLVYISGVRDLPNRRMDALSRESMQSHCVQGVSSVPMSRAEHAPPDRRHFARALAALDPRPPAPVASDAGLAGCRGRLATAVDAALAKVDALIESGDLDAAGEQLGEVDLRWGGLAAPRSVELARSLAGLRAHGGDDGR